MISFSMINGKYYIYAIWQIVMESLLYESNAILSAVDNTGDANDRDPDFE